MKLNGVISYFDSRCPTQEELDSCKKIYLTADIPWEPYDSSYESQEEAARLLAAVFQDGPEPELFDVIPPPVVYCDDMELADRFVEAVNVASDDLEGNGLSGHLNEDVYPIGDEGRSVMALTTDEKLGVITKEVLARRWGIGLDTAHRTL